MFGRRNHDDDRFLGLNLTHSIDQTSPRQPPPPIDNHLPNRSSPKLPHPIFFPTRKFGPTISTPEEELTECLVEYMLAVVAPPPVVPPPVLTACEAEVAGTALERKRKREIELIHL